MRKLQEKPRRNRPCRRNPDQATNPGGYMQHHVRFVFAALNYQPAHTLQIMGYRIMPYTAKHLLHLLHRAGCHVWMSEATLLERLRKLHKAGLVINARIKYRTGDKFMTVRTFSCWFLAGRVQFDLSVIGDLRQTLTDKAAPDPVTVALDDVTPEQMEANRQLCREYGLPDPYQILPGALRG